ncbi:MAG: phage portal protein family protein, partial [Flectobacillus sp.]|uniref:phage portal protein family protein n=1 Tax=Flectobacillus sp. TaxID=50419 RepID=UPI003B9D7EC6
GQSCWAEHTEGFSIPPLVLKTDTSDTKMLARGKKMMEEGRGRMSYFIIGEDESLEFADQVATKGELYDGLITQCKSELSLLFSGAVVGQDTKNGSNAKESSSQELLWYRVQFDMKLLEQQWNKINLPALAKHGLIKEGLTLEFEKAEDITQLWKFVSESMSNFDYDIDWINEKFGLKVIASKSNNQSQGLSLSKSFFLGASDTTEAHLNCCGNPHMIQLSSSYSADKIAKSIWEAEGLKKFDIDLFKFTANELSKGFNDGYKQGNKVHLAAFGLEYGYDSPAKLTAYEMNLFRFSAGKTIAQVQALNKAFRNAKSFEDFRISAALIAGQFNENWLRTEYNTAIAVGNSAAQYDRLVSTANTFPYWEYRTQDDNRVRLDHQLLDGITLRADDPLWKKLYPPNGWNCRCFIAPRLASEVDQQALDTNQSIASNFVESDGWQNVENAGFGVNRAETQEVFTNNQQYVKRVEANKLIAELSPSDYNIKVPDNKPTRQLFTGTIEEFIREQGTDFTDYNKRKISFSATDMTAIAEASNELFAELQNVLQKPDEVWFTGATKGKDLNQYLYVKYYNDTAIALIAEMTKDGLTVVNFLKLLDQVLRWGLLIK